MKKIYLILSFLFLGIVVNAQTAASYGFTAFSSTFTSISGTGTPIPLLSDDDYTEASIPIGFTFSFCGTPYTSLSACSNGWVSLSESPTTTFDNLELFIDGPGWLMPFWDDLDGFAGNAYYQTTGIAPNRIFTIEWNNWEVLGGTGFDFGTFQVKLYETSNIIDFHYGPSTMSLASATMGIANDAISDWQTLSDESAAPTPLLAPLFETFIFSSPADGQVYRWTPTICSLSAIGGTLTTCTGLTTTLTNDTLGGTWSSSDITIADVDAVTGDVLGMSAGIATITYTTGAGCFVTADVTVTAPTPITGTLSVCAGLTTALSNATAGGTWSSSDGTVADVGSTTGIVSGLSPGTTTISYTLPSGCVASVDVTVDPTPTGIIGPSSICQGSTATMTSTPSGGTWISSFSSIATIDAAGTVTGILGGVTTISYTLPSGCFRTTSLTVNPLPAPITGSTSICVAATSLLGSTTAGGTWASSLPGVATVSGSGLVTGISPGTAVISYTLASGCYRTVTVTVVSVVAPISGPTTVCRLQGASYTNSTTGGTWSSSIPAVGTISSGGAFTAISVGTTTISYILGSGCFTSLTVTVNPNELITGTGIVCQGQTTTMSNAIAGGTWTSADVTIFTVGSTSGLVTGVSAGTALVSYTNTSGCVSTSTITVSPTPSAITGSLLICIGNTTALGSTPTGGTWSSSNTAVGTIGLSSGIATGLSSGTSTIIYTSTNGCVISAVLTVNPTPAPISGITVYCPNTTAFLSHPVSGGTWSSSNPAVATVGSSSGLVTGISLAGGTATITYTLPASGCIATYNITVNPAPVISGATAICVATNTTLTSSMLGSTWTSSNTAVATIGSSSGILTGVAAGTSTITCFGSNGCPNSVVVTVNTSPTAITGTTTVCVNATTTLNSTPAGGAWTSSAPGTASVNASGVVTGNAAGVATITYTVGVGCFVTANVTVNPIPSAIGGTASVCIGLTTILNSSPGGTWSSSNTSVATIGSSSGTATGLAAGTSNISYILTTTGCFRTRVLTVNPLPAAIGGATTVCPGSNVTLTNTSFGGTWSSSTPAVATVGSNTGIVTGVSGGATTITYTLPTTCIATVAVTVIAAPVATITPIGDTILCPGGFVTLTSSAAVGATYQWYIGGSPIGSATSPTYIASTPGSYQVRVSVAAGCTTLSSPMSVSIVPATATITVAGGLTTTCSGTAIVLNANTGVGLTYQWELGGTAIAGATASTYNALTGGSYTVRVTNSAGCWAVSSPVIITVNPAPSNIVTISGPLTICNGSTVTFTAASGTGYSYQWYNAAGAITGATSISYTTNVAGSFHAVVTDGIGCSSTTATSVVVVNPLPNVTITPGGPRIFCAGGSVALDAVPGFSYQWYRNGVAIAGATNSTYTATLSGGYRVRVTNTTTGCTAMTGADTTVTAVGTPVILPLTPAKFCWGGSALLSTSVSGPLGTAVLYQWYFNGVLIPGATLSTYNATVAGNYSCSIQVPASCTQSTGTVAVTEMPLPDPPITLVGSSFRTGNYYITYQWYKNLIPIPGATAYSTPATGNGNYKVAVTDTNGCQSVSAVYVLTNWVSNGVVDINNTDVKIFPNPASMMVHIECAQYVTVVICGIDGKAIINQPNAKDIDISKVADGVYMIMVYDENNNLLKTKKLIKASE